jgi:hypothetical protein
MSCNPKEPTTNLGFCMFWSFPAVQVASVLWDLHGPLPLSPLLTERLILNHSILWGWWPCLILALAVYHRGGYEIV